MIECLVPSDDVCGEGLTWDASADSLYWCDINRFLIHRFDLARRTRHSWSFDEPVVALSLTKEPGRLLVATAARLLAWQPRQDTRWDLGFRFADWPEARLNDGRAAPNGDFWIGSMANNVGPRGEGRPVAGTKGVLMRIPPSGDAEIIKRGIGISNTLCWSPDRATFYFGDSIRNVIWAYDYDPQSGAVSGERSFFEGFDRGAPDGSAMDAEGYLWNCRFGGGCVVRVAPDGKIGRVVDLPVSNPTTCAFGGPGLKTLYITSATLDAPPEDRLAGSLFALPVQTPGLPAFRAGL